LEVTLEYKVLTHFPHVAKFPRKAGLIPSSIVDV